MKKNKWSRRKKWLVLGVVPTVLVVGGAASAAWLLEGSGSTTSTETTGTAGSAPVTLSAPNKTDAIVAGGPAVTIPVTVTNPGSAAVNVNEVDLTVTSDSNSSCPVADFITTPDMTPFQVPVGPTGVVANVQLALSGSAPLACESTSLSLSETAS